MWEEPYIRIHLNKGNCNRPQKDITASPIGIQSKISLPIKKKKREGKRVRGEKGEKEKFGPGKGKNEGVQYKVHIMRTARQHEGNISLKKTEKR